MERSAAGQAWILSDGNAGNVRQAQSLAAALGLLPLEWTLQSRAPWRWLAPRCLPGAQGAFGDGFAEALATPPALAIGCGRQAALATRLLHARGTKTVQVLDPRLATSHWDIVVAPTHDRLVGANVVTLLGSLHPVDDAWLARARDMFPALGQLPGPRTTLLVGGPTSAARFDRAALDGWFDTVAAAVAAEGGSLLVSASRRTPAGMRARLRERCLPAGATCWFDDSDGPNPYPGMLAWADRIVCTPDSVNMLSEACATTAPVFVADPHCVRGRIGGFLDALAGAGRVRRLDGPLDAFATQPLRETARVAAEVRQRLALA